MKELRATERGTQLGKMSFRAVALATLSALTGAWAYAQTAQAPATVNQVAGEVTAIVAVSRQISIKTDKGEAITVAVSDSASFRRVAPGAQDLTKATRITFSDLSVGDRILAIGPKPADPRKVEARTVIVMNRTDVTQLRQRERENWQKRGAAGTVSAIDIGASTFTIKSGPRNLTIQPSGKTEYRRYSPDSVKFSEAQPSSLAEIKTGDQVRVLGERSADGTSVAAEQIVSGSFRQIAATISSVNASAGEIVIKDLATKKAITVLVNSDSTMRTLPPTVATAMTRRYQPNAGRSEHSGARESGAEAAASEHIGSSGSEDIGQMLDRLPAIPLSDLKPGDAIMLSSTTGSDPARVTAVMLLAGVEPLLRASPTATRDIMSGWNLGAGEGAQ